MGVLGLDGPETDAFSDPGAICAYGAKQNILVGCRSVPGLAALLLLREPGDMVPPAGRPRCLMTRRISYCFHRIILVFRCWGPELGVGSGLTRIDIFPITVLEFEK